MKIQPTLLLLSLFGGLALASTPVLAHCGSCGVGDQKSEHAACPEGCDKPCCAKKAECPPDCDKPCCAKKDECAKGCEGKDAAACEMAAGEHKLTGVIVSIDASKRMLVVKHDEVPGVMKAMTMGFTVPECCPIDGLKAGDHITGILVKAGNQYMLKGPKAQAAM